MNDPIAALLRQQPCVVLDGALATELERRGADLHDPLWSAKILIEQPHLIRDVHRDYFRAGADIATTATYQASFTGFARRGIAHAAAARLMCNAVALAVEARDDYWHSQADQSTRLRPLVAASLGPYGAMLADGSEYRGHYAASDLQLREFHAPRIDALLESGCDLFACETIPCLREAMVLAQVLQERGGPGAWLSFSCADGSRNCEGEAIADCAAALESCSAILAIGVNCTPPRFIADLLRHMRAACTKTLLVYPNSGEIYDPVAKHWHERADAGALATQARTWYEAGARMIGGCCRTSPADIEALDLMRRRLPH